MHQLQLNKGSTRVAAPLSSKKTTFLYGDGRLDRRMRIVTDEFEIFERKIVDVFDGRI